MILPQVAYWSNVKVNVIRTLAHSCKPCASVQTTTYLSERILAFRNFKLALKLNYDTLHAYSC